MESENMNQGEVNSPSSQSTEPKNDTLVPSQSSIFLLTLDELQNSLSENGKNFGSMNMDEFLTTIWTAEEQAQGNSPPAGPYATTENNALLRQASLSVPEPLGSKTVDQVWSEIHKNDEAANVDPNPNPNPNPAQRQTTFGDMTLEDFLVRAGIVRAAVQNFAPYDEMQQQQQNMMPVNAAPPVGPASLIARSPMMGMGGGVGNYPTGVVYPHQPPPAVGYGGRMGNVGSGGGYGMQGIGSPASPASSAGPGQVDGGPGAGRRRIIDGPVERVVERRQRRMIKNRESAARSRARKQAYTVELEAELNQLKDENEQLKQALELQKRRLRQQFDEEERATKKLRAMRRTSSF